MKKYLIIICSTLLLLGSCGQKNEEKGLEQLDKKSAREVILTTIKSGDSVFHITKQTIWYNGDKLTDKIDTIVTPNKTNTWSSSESSPSSSLAEVPIYVTVQ